MSVLNSHLYAGAAILLTNKSVADAEFWKFFRTEAATSLSGVPFTFDLLERIGFRSQHYPSLRYLTQAGGRLSSDRVRLYGDWARACGREMFVMYGQTEASPRMAYVPPQQLLDNVDAIGIPVPGGSFELLAEDGEIIQAYDTPGELVYRGPNVMMGYADSMNDLARGAETSELRTGDLASRKENGCYYIIGRKSRFSKIVGLRISLDEIERWINECGLHGIVSGDDRVIVVAITQSNASCDLKRRLIARFTLPASVLRVLVLESIPTLQSGKFDYRSVLRLGLESIDAARSTQQSLLEAYREVLGNDDIRPGDSFLDLGGDSINLVELSLVLENYLGVVPDNWEARTIASLETLRSAMVATHDTAIGSTGNKDKRRGGVLQAGLIALAVLLVGEAALQMRSYLKTGRSALNILDGESRIIMNERFEVKTYRPNLKDLDPSDEKEFTTNTLGFRSPEISTVPAQGEMRIAVVGASTVSGAYAKTNSATFPYLLEERLRKALPGLPVNVINAGVEGYTVREMDQLVERAVIPLRPSVVLIYPGFNDMAYICRPVSGKANVVMQPVAAPALPSWVLTRELISKNTLALRETPARTTKADLKTQFPVGYRQSLESMVAKINAAGIRPVLVTVASGFKQSDGKAGKLLATTALFYNHCLDYEGLIEAGSLFNQMIKDVAKSHGASLIDIGSMMPSGTKYFVDSAHFTRAGEELSSELIYRELVNFSTDVKPAGLMASN